MAEKRTAKNQEVVDPQVKVAPEETVEAVVTNADAEVSADTEVIENGEITEVRDEVEEAPKKKESKKLTKEEKRIQELADAAEGGAYGTGRERMIALGTDYAAVQAELTKRYRESQNNNK